MFKLKRLTTTILLLFFGFGLAGCGGGGGSSSGGGLTSDSNGALFEQAFDATGGNVKKDSLLVYMGSSVFEL